MDKESICDNCNSPLDSDIGWTYYERLPFPTSKLPIGEHGIVCNDCNTVLSMFITMVNFKGIE